MITKKHFQRVFAKVMQLSLRQTAEVLFNRFAPSTIRMRGTVLKATSDKHGLEIGGPSEIFRSVKLLPIYNCAERIDNINFALQTRWEHELKDGPYFRFNSKKDPGIQLIREAKSLTGIDDGFYDFVISSHCLEHLADPISALREWARVTKRGGFLILVVPNPRYTFDHRRPITSIDHLIEDHSRKVAEDDLTHLPEILSLHDLNWDPGAESPAGFRERSLRNAEIRCLHHHVFDSQLLGAVLQAAGWEVLAVERVRPIHIIAFAHNTRRSTSK